MRILFEQAGLAGGIEVGEGLRQQANVRRGEVQAFRAGCGNDVRRIAGEIKPAVLHRLDDETPHGRNPLLEHGAFGELPISVDCEARVELTPDSIVRPVVDVLLGGNLQVEAADLRGAHAQQCEAALVIRIDQFV